MFGGLATPAITMIPELYRRDDSSLTPHAYDFELAQDYLEQAGYKVKRASFNGTNIVLILGLLGLSFIQFLRHKKR